MSEVNKRMSEGDKWMSEGDKRMKGLKNDGGGGGREG